MKLYKSIIISAFSLITIGACNSKPNGGETAANTATANSIIKETLSPDAYQKMMLAKQDFLLIDVRTPGEYATKHLAGAVNYDYNGPDFEKNIQGLDNSKVVFVHCMSGGRSSSAMDIFEKAGFKEIYNMEGGLMRWTAENRPFENLDTATISGMTMETYEKEVASAPLVMVDFNAVWCGPCKKLKPVLEDMEKKGLFKLVTIDVDVNNLVAEHFKISSIPLMKLYSKGKEVWSKQGFDASMQEAEVTDIMNAIKNNK